MVSNRAHARNTAIAHRADVKSLWRDGIGKGRGRGRVNIYSIYLETRWDENDVNDISEGIAGARVSSHWICDDKSGIANHDVVCSAACLVSILVLFLENSTVTCSEHSTVRHFFWIKSSDYY